MIRSSGYDISTFLGKFSYNSHNNTIISRGLLMCSRIAAFPLNVHIILSSLAVDLVILLFTATAVFHSLGCF